MTKFDINDLWIPIKRKKPDVGQKCIISTKDYGVEVGIFCDDGVENQIWSDTKNCNRNIFCKYYFDCNYLSSACPWYTMKEVDAWIPMPAIYTYTYRGKVKKNETCN